MKPLFEVKPTSPPADTTELIGALRKAHDMILDLLLEGEFKRNMELDISYINKALNKARRTHND